MKVYINAGHGLNINNKLDPGAVGPTGLTEAAVTADLAGRLGHLLRAKGHTTYGIKPESYVAAAREANRLGVDILISLHCNAATLPAAHGCETLYLTQAGLHKATAIQRSIMDALNDGSSVWLNGLPVPLTDRGVKQRTNLHILKAARMPAVLVEVAFISNPREEKLLRTPTFLQAVAQAIADAV